MPKVTRKISWKTQRNYAFNQDAYIVTIPGNKKAGTVLHKKGEVLDIREYLEFDDGTKFYRTAEQVKENDMRGYGKSKLTRLETGNIKSVTFS